MKKIFWTIVVIVAVYTIGLWMTRSESKPQSQAFVAATERPSTSTPRLTRTPVPSATIGYQETAIVAQATADEARRVNAVVTAAFEQRAQEQLQMTAQFEQRVQEIYSWTATAALVSVPLTATQQAALNTQIPMRSTLESAYLTATHGAPTQEAAMQQAIYFRKYGALDYFARWFFVIAIGAFLLGLLAWILRNPVLPKQVEEPEEVEPVCVADATGREETVVMLKRPGTGGDFSKQRFVIPCTSDQLTELCNGIVNGGRSFAINQWEGKDTLFTRDTILRVRGWFEMNAFAVHSPDNQLTATPEGEDFMYSWLESHRLPDNYYFEAEDSGPARAAAGGEVVERV